MSLFSRSTRPSVARPTRAPRARAVARVALASGTGAASLLLFSGTALAHVGVQPQGEAAKGGYATVSFKVPNERDNASTVKLEVSLPSRYPLASVMPQPVPGWKAEVTKTKLAEPLDMHGRKITEAVSKVTWTADGAKIGPGEFQQFPLSIGQLPEDTDSLVFKAIQTYDNKEVVRWIEEAQEGAPEPEAPAPVLTLSDAKDDGHGASQPDGTESKGSEHNGEGAKDGQQPTEKASADDSTDTTARVLAVVGILAGVAGVVFGVLAGRRRAS
jgi:periplasmic copper chaperone A